MKTNTNTKKLAVTVTLMFVLIILTSNLFAKSLDQLYVQTKNGYKSISEIRDTENYQKQRLTLRDHGLKIGIFADSLGKERYKLPGGSNDISGIVIDQNNTLWVTTVVDYTDKKNIPGQLSYYNPTKDKFVGCGQPKGEGWLSNLFLDQEGNKWLVGEYCGTMIACFTKEGKWFSWPIGGLGFEEKLLLYNDNNQLEKVFFLSDYSAIEINFKSKKISKKANWHKERFAFDGEGGREEMFFNASKILQYSFDTGMLKYKNEGGFINEVTLK